MRKRALLLLITVLLVCVVILAAFGCKEKPDDPDVSPVYDVSEGTKDVYTALKEAVDLRAYESYYVAFDCEIDKGEGEKNTVINFAAVFDKNDETLSADQIAKGESNTKLCLRVATAQEDKEILSVNYVAGVLYINYPVTVKTAAVRNIPLWRVADYLHSSLYSEDGTLRSVSSVLPDIGNRLFASCELTKDSETGISQYVFTVDKDTLQSGISFLATYLSGLMRENELYALLGLDAGADSIGDATIQAVFNVKVEGAVKTLVGAEMRKTVGETTYTHTLENLSCVGLNAGTIKQYAAKVKTADTLSSNYSYYHPANLSLRGTLTLDVKSALVNTAFWSTPVVANLQAADWVFDLDWHSVYTAEGEFSFDATLAAQFDPACVVSLYYAQGILYVDASALGLGQWKVPNERLQQLASDLNGDYTYAHWSDDTIRDVLLDLLVDRSDDGTTTTYSLSGAHADTLWRELQNTLTGSALSVALPGDLRGATLSLVERNNKFASLTLTCSFAGLDVIVACNDPVVGKDKDVTVTCPQWVADLADPAVETKTADEQEYYTITADGQISAFTGIIQYTQILESFLSSISGSDVRLGDNQLANYKAAITFGKTGALHAFLFDFYTENGTFVCSLYHHVAASDKLYVILPDENGKTPIIALTVKMQDRYSAFLQAISPGGAVNSEMNACEVRAGDGYLRIGYSAAGFNALLGRLSAVLPDLRTSLPGDAFVQEVRITTGATSALRIVFGGDRYVEFGVDHFAVGDMSLDVQSSLGNKAVSLFDNNDLPADVQVKTVYADGKSRTLAVSLASVNTDWTYDAEPSMGAGNVSVHASCSILGQNVSMLLYVDCNAPDSYKLEGGGAYAKYLEGKQFTFARYTDQTVLRNTIDAYSRVAITIGGKTTNHLLTWTHGGDAFAVADFENPDLGTQGNDSFYSLIPTVTGYFGKSIALADVSSAYKICLRGEMVSGVQNSSELLVIAAYADAYDPFSGETYENLCKNKYGQKTPVFLNAQYEAMAVGNVYWDVDSIDKLSGSNDIIRIDGKALAKKELQAALKTQLYALDGKYKMNVAVINSLGFKKNFEVYIRVAPMRIEQISFADDKLAAGITYTPGIDNAPGTFSIAAGTYESLGSNYPFAYEVNCVFSDGTAQTFAAKDWTCTPQDAIRMFSAYQGSVILSIGDDRGGKQKQEMTYAIEAFPVAELALWGVDKNGDKQVLAASKQAASADSNAVTFDLTGDNALDPYDFLYPKGLAVIPADALLATEYVAAQWIFAGWNEAALWHSADRVYETGSKLYNLDVTIRLQFQPKEIVSWSFVSKGVEYVPDDNGAYVYDNDAYALYDSGNDNHVSLPRYSRADVVAEIPLATPMYELAAGGAYVLVNDNYVPYDSTDPAHNGRPRYRQVNTYEVLYRTLAAGVEWLILDPNLVDYKVAASYPAQVEVTFADGTQKRLDAVWDLAKLQSLTASQTFADTVGLSVGLQQFVADVRVRIGAVSTAKKYVPVARDANGTITEYGDVISVSVLQAQSGALVANDIASAAYLHSLICGCGDNDCLGYVYFQYEDSDNANMKFAITEWRNLDNITKCFASVDSVEQVGRKVTVIAVANNIECEIGIDIVETPLLALHFDEAGIPRTVSSLSTGGQSAYSMQVVAPTQAGCALALKVDPYLANVLDAACYPTRLQFNLGGDDVKCVVGGWDLSAIRSITPYLGAEAVIACLLDTPMGKVRIPVQLSVQPRIIQSVLIDGEETRILHIDALSNTPFGTDLIKMDGHEYAYKMVGVKFQGDDLIYNMMMRYDIGGYDDSGITRATYAAAQLDHTIEVKSTDGYLTVLGRNRMIVADQVRSVRLDLDFLQENDLKRASGYEGVYTALVTYFGEGWDGYIYRKGVFADFADTAAGNVAWRAFVEQCDRLIVECGAYNIEVGNNSGGFQPLKNYMLFSVANQILTVRCDLDAVRTLGEGEDSAYKALIDYFGVGWDGTLYQNDAFVEFADTEAGNAAWRALTVFCDCLIVECGIYVESEYVLYDSQNEEHATLPKYRLDAYDYALSPTGAYVFYEGAFVPYNAQSAAHVGLQRYALRTALAERNDDGAYVWVVDSFVPYDAQNPNHAGGRPRYDLSNAGAAYMFNVYRESATGNYVFAGGNFVMYNSGMHAGYTRFAAAQANRFGFVEDEGGLYVYVDDNYVLYDENKTSHSGRTRYSLVPDTPYVYVVDDYGSYVCQNGRMTAYLTDGSHDGLTRYRAVSYSYVQDNGGAYVRTVAHADTRTFVAKQSREGNGLEYCWIRRSMGGDDNVVLEVYNKNAIFDAHLATKQYINTYMSRYITLTRSMLTLDDLVKIEQEGVATLDYQNGFTAGAFCDAYGAGGVIGEMGILKTSQLTYAIYAASDTTFSSPLAANAVLHAGDYVMLVGVQDNILYGNYWSEPIRVRSAALDNVKVTVSGQEYLLAELAQDGCVVSALTSLSVDSGIADATIGVAFYEGENRLDSMPYKAGEYTVVFDSKNTDYALVPGQESFVLVIGNA